MSTAIKGIIPLMKPVGFTSHDCVNKLRKILKTKRIGHTGTLDPSVSGVLPICVGQATRVVEYVQELSKEYVGTVTIGKSTTTEDADGELVACQEVFPPLQITQIHQVLNNFTGKIMQTPPMFSAIKINGVRLHELARKGMEVERKPREVEIYSIELLKTMLDQPFPEISFRVVCSKGTYVRTLCVDIGLALGYPAHMSYLQRTASGPFKLEDCYHFEEIEQAVREDQIDLLLRPLDTALVHYPKIEVPMEKKKDVWNGKRLKIPSEFAEGQLIRVYSVEQQFLALYKVVRDEGEFFAKPEKVFHEEGEMKHEH
ncbi:tRNA pseudouridine(55) synthase TruB [Ammoniphilus resinae]|uniref:tRNA pseudouridine synthase B n=1 Tax=Ammoniphilus resinae TaxID=861532 RepID=A0ABS4GMQ9_9BACL|nr:tRNA pseudouridine(55) synthase TruB [Ammoniphilus resinae]MBP1931536.1 tRNA pseudouridine55 synthase [Ammoniphilus resinae]